MCKLKKVLIVEVPGGWHRYENGDKKGWYFVPPAIQQIFLDLPERAAPPSEEPQKEEVKK